MSLISHYALYYIIRVFFGARHKTYEWRQTHDVSGRSLRLFCRRLLCINLSPTSSRLAQNLFKTWFQQVSDQDRSTLELGYNQATTKYSYRAGLSALMSSRVSHQNLNSWRKPSRSSMSFLAAYVTDLDSDDWPLTRCRGWMDFRYFDPPFHTLQFFVKDPSTHLFTGIAARQRVRISKIHSSSAAHPVNTAFCTIRKSGSVMSRWNRRMPLPIIWRARNVSPIRRSRIWN